MAKKKNTTRKDGRIAVQVYIGRELLGYDDDGKAEYRRKYKTVYGKTQKEANEKAEEIKLAMRKGIDITSGNDEFSKWSNRFLEIKLTEIGVSQSKEYTHKVRLINGYIGNVPISQLKTIDLQKIITDLAKRNPSTGRPSSKRVLEITKNTLSQIFELAIENRVLDYNPAKAVKTPKTKAPNQRRALTAEEQGWIVGREHRAQTAAMVMMYAGLRRGELIPLSWNDVDLEAKTITINKAVELHSNEFVVKNTTKTDAGMRTIDIPAILAEYLGGVKRSSVLVCTSANGKMHTLTSWRRMWDSYLTALNKEYGEVRTIGGAFGKQETSIPEITPHWLRHTFATLLYMSGVDVLTAKEQLGHADIRTTLGIYTHLDKEHKRRAMDKLDVFLEDASQMQVKTVESK